ncbi:hypothetical protein Tco_0990003 [Tanacetum coccineum]|uniref:Uncharacterized protein n=1 Tax=Tanacetum coccineum TaxID=301880 RepID=A0ABQ5EVG4_9ASTR
MCILHLSIAIKFEIEDNGELKCRAIKRALEIKEDIYKEWCLEFFSSIHFKPVKKNEMMDKKFIAKEKTLDGPRPKVADIKDVFKRLVHKVIVNSFVHRNKTQHKYFVSDSWVMHFLDLENARMNVPWILAQHLSKKAAGMKEASDINGGHYVFKIARNLGYFTSNETKKCSAPVQGTLLDEKVLKGILDHGKMKLKENDEEEEINKPKGKEVKRSYKIEEESVREEEVDKSNKWRDAMLLKTGYQLDYASPILIYLGSTSGYTFASEYKPPMVPPYPYYTTSFTNMENVTNAVVERVVEPLNE